MARAAEEGGNNEKILASFFSSNREHDIRTAGARGMWLWGKGWFGRVLH